MLLKTLIKSRLANYVFDGRESRSFEVTLKPSLDFVTRF
jgi:hypothetical protein